MTQDYEDAHEEFTRALELRSDWGDIYLARGRNFTAQKLYENAIQDLSKGLKLDESPNFTQLDAVPTLVGENWRKPYRIATNPLISNRTITGFHSITVVSFTIDLATT